MQKQIYVQLNCTKSMWLIGTSNSTHTNRLPVSSFHFFWDVKKCKANLDWTLRKRHAVNSMRYKKINKISAFDLWKPVCRFWSICSRKIWKLQNKNKNQTLLLIPISSEKSLYKSIIKSIHTLCVMSLSSFKCYTLELNQKK